MVKDLVLKKEDMDIFESKAADILNKLVKGIKNPNKYIIDELISLVLDSEKKTVDMKEVLQNAKILFSELLKDAKDPDVELIDEYLTLLLNARVGLSEEDSTESEDVVKSDSQESDGSSKTKQVDNEVNMQNIPIPPKMKEGIAEIKNDIKDLPNNEDVTKSETGQAMLGLMMDEIKELMSMTSDNADKFKQQDEKTQTAIEAMQKEQKAIREELDELKDKFGTVEKSIEKFIGLYEVVTNMYNPFIKKDDSSKNFFDKKIEETKQKE